MVLQDALSGQGVCKGAYDKTTKKISVCGIEKDDDCLKYMNGKLSGKCQTEVISGIFTSNQTMEGLQNMTEDDDACLSRLSNTTSGEIAALPSAAAMLMSALMLIHS